MDLDSLSNPELLLHVKELPAPSELELTLADRLEEATRELERVHQLALKELARLQQGERAIYA
jgi:hypothetical protein